MKRASFGVASPNASRTCWGTSLTSLPPARTAMRMASGASSGPSRSPVTAFSTPSTAPLAEDWPAAPSSDAPSPPSTPATDAALPTARWAPCATKSWMTRTGAPTGPIEPNARPPMTWCTRSMRDTSPANAWPPSLLIARSSAGVIAHPRKRPLMYSSFLITPFIPRANGCLTRETGVQPPLCPELRSYPQQPHRAPAGEPPERLRGRLLDHKSLRAWRGERHPVRLGDERRVAHLHDDPHGRPRLLRQVRGEQPGDPRHLGLDRRPVGDVPLERFLPAVAAGQVRRVVHVGVAAAPAQQHQPRPGHRPELGGKRVRVGGGQVADGVDAQPGELPGRLGADAPQRVGGPAPQDLEPVTEGQAEHPGRLAEPCGDLGL